MPEFDVTIQTVRSGTHVVRFAAENEAAAREAATQECAAGECHCPPDWCTDDVESTILQLRRVVLDDVTIITAEGTGLGMLYADDSLRRGQRPRG